MLDTEDLSADEWEVLREPTPDDYKSLEEDAEVERDAFKVCQQLISKRKLPMKLVKVEYAFDRSQALFYFTAETRVDFRELVRDLAHKFRTRIELKQVGVRDEARILGGIGYCGRELCCKAFLKSFQPVSKKMARDQNLTLNPSKISGICGRLLCCLIYEQETYEELRRKFPKEGSMVDTPSGPGRVKMLNPLKGLVEVQLEGGTTKSFDVSVVASARKEPTSRSGKTESVEAPVDSPDDEGQKN
ncbi:stage 0 sporulation protein [bacterium]|nr:stage 0 sporulation protein [bacterium]